MAVSHLFVFSLETDGKGNRTPPKLPYRGSTVTVNRKPAVNPERRSPVLQTGHLTDKVRLVTLSKTGPHCVDMWLT